ncbi:hypothetical protein K435DRAFT_827437 [Dendrothele bispora CBS 962.96]|uniref:Uncharacterized protein n=1 Tax=Dendrothele bispora (strain CBS 962.96) TaxID=1314807 RepID=A0A4V4HHG1_DENBC|nr:hypothetical protein K435DRAFT_827437 [Dendrothele bispora CBS 962.96]
MSTNMSSNMPTTRPEHQVHDSSDPLPGARGAQSGAVDYSPETIERMPTSQLDQQGVPETHTEGRNAFTESRPMDVKPTDNGGVAIGGRSDLPEGKAKMTDKIIGKTEKVIGKMTKNPEMHEKGELREAGGKAATIGEARAPHD